MNFNPMDLINLKEKFCPSNHLDFKAITKFIGWLLDIQKDGLSEMMKETLGEEFIKKQEMIEMAYQLRKMGYNNKLFKEDK